MHTETRSKVLFEYLYKLVLSVRYDRILESQPETAVYMDFEEMGVVVPAQLCREFFTI